MEVGLMEGQILGNRYELIEKIGGGGMALVYKAKCRLLNRYVAVKILRSEFTNDEEFVKRFRIEAQSAASLSHPNIVSIYDVGHDGSVHYIIMEYIDGITLKEYISQKGALGWKEAVNISIQISSAIETAHRNHIIHRDIKPHNILITRDGIAKVTDFGIARAVSSSTITMVGSTIGSVHYFSPEQARGGFIDEKSDLYSLGIALFEMVTGRVPFDGESPVAIALKHIQDEITEPAALDASIPKGVNDIIVKAVKKEPGKRYQTASEFLGDLYKVLKEPQGGFVTESNLESSPTRRVQIISEENLVRKDEYRIKEMEEDTVKTAKKKDKVTYWLAGLTSLVIMAIFVVIGYKIVIPNLPDSKASFEMKDYVGQSIDTVKEDLRQLGIEKINIKEEVSDTVEKGIIISQKPDKTLTINPKGEYDIEFVVSKGLDLVKIPDYKGKDPREVEKDLRDSGLEYKEEQENSETIAQERVTRSDPAADEEIKRGEAVTVYVSKGPEVKFTKVPNLVGKSQKEATQLLLDANLAIGNIFPEDGSNFVDKIVKQEPAAYSDIKEDEAVDIYFEADTTGSQVKEVSYSINLADPDSFKDTVKILVEITPSDTNLPQIIIDEEKNKTDFPLELHIPVPDGGSTKVRIYLDGKPYVPELTMSSTRR
jgi:eukaryotic-like serine/threonine-protein kinase